MKQALSRRALMALAGLLVGGAAGLAMAQEKALRIGVDGTYPPFSELGKGGKLSGFDIDIARALCEQMRAKCELVIMDDWAQVLSTVETGRVDAAVASMSVSDERLKRIDFTKKYYQTPAKFVAKQGTEFPATSAGMATKRIGVQGGTTHEDFLRGRFGGAVPFKTYQTVGQALDDLRAGKLDLVMADSLALEVGFLGSKEGKGYAFVGPDFSDPRWFGVGNAIALPKNQAALRENLNTAIGEIRANGTYKVIASKYFNFDIYGDETD